LVVTKRKSIGSSFIQTTGAETGTLTAAVQSFRGDAEIAQSSSSLEWFHRAARVQRTTLPRRAMNSHTASDKYARAR